MSPEEGQNRLSRADRLKIHTVVFVDGVLEPAYQSRKYPGLNGCFGDLIDPLLHEYNKKYRTNITLDDLWYRIKDKLVEIERTRPRRSFYELYHPKRAVWQSILEHIERLQDSHARAEKGNVNRYLGADILHTPESLQNEISRLMEQKKALQAKVDALKQRGQTELQEGHQRLEGNLAKYGLTLQFYLEELIQKSTT